MLHLLHKCTRPGYPLDYILSRIRGRMATHVSGVDGVSVDNSRFQADDTSIRDAAAEERRWIYMQMDADLRESLAPLLLYFELNTFVLCLRSLETHPPDIMVVNLDNSLLTAELKKIVQAKTTPADVVVKLERFLGSSALGLDGLSASYEAGGVQRCEELIRRRFFEQVSVTRMHPQMVNFFRRIIDLKNTMTMAKCLRWNKQEVPALINGGHVRIRKADQVPSQSGVEKMVQRCTGGRKVTAAELQPVNLEPLLYEHLAGRMIREMQSGDPVGCCMGYVWHCYGASRRRSIAYHATRFAEQFPGSGESVQ